MGQISFKIILVVPLFVLPILVCFYGYDIDIVDGKLNIRSIFGHKQKALIGKKSLLLFNF